MGNNKRMLFEIVLAVFYPFDLERLKNNVACLIVEEIGDLGGGFRVVAGDVKPVDSLPDERKQEFYAFFNLLEKNDDIVAIVLFQIKSLKSSENIFIMNTMKYGDRSALSRTLRTAKEMVLKWGAIKGITMVGV
jgi:hypothetical protein